MTTPSLRASSIAASTDPEKLREIDSPPALAWAREWSAATEEMLDTPVRAQLESRLEDILNADDSLDHVSRRGDKLYNFHRDEQHPRGVWHRTDEPSYLAGEPAWEIMLDVDALAADEGENWVYKGTHVRRFAHDRALVELSRGGADATVIREFDLEQRRFVTEDPFVIDEAKSSVSWLDRDTIIVGTDTGPSSLTDSGYPVEARLWRRGEKLEKAPIIARGEPSNVAAGVDADTTVGYERLVFYRALGMHDAREWIAPFPGGDELPHWQLIDVPDDCDTIVRNDLLFLRPRTDFIGIPAGGLGVTDLSAFLDGDRNATVIFAPDEHSTLESVGFTRDHLVLTELKDVSTRISLKRLADLTAEAQSIDLPDLLTATITATSPDDGNEIWLVTRSFTEPPALLRVADAAATRTPMTVRSRSAVFDASGLETRQHWARSADGTKIPYFITGAFTRIPLPCLVKAYGGFEISVLPDYPMLAGPAWLEEGYFLVSANLRGGGEFGPQWHQQATVLDRMKVFEDHQAVLEDLVERGYTTPEQLAIQGGSNGGLLTATALNRYPSAFGAAVVMVPLADMLHFHTMLAGASWMSEYGSPEIPEQRAVLASYSPVHNVAPATDTTYPPALVTTSTRDDRVHPAHARLFAHALARAGQPVDYLENTEGGHAGAADHAQTAHLNASIFAWLRGIVAGESSKG